MITLWRCYDPFIMIYPFVIIGALWITIMTWFYMILLLNVFFKIYMLFGRCGFCLSFFRLFFTLGWFYFMQAILSHNQGKVGEICIIIPWWFDSFTTKLGKYHFFFLSFTSFVSIISFQIFPFHYTCKGGHPLTSKFGPPKVVPS